MELISQIFTLVHAGILLGGFLIGVIMMSFLFQKVNKVSDGSFEYKDQTPDDEDDDPEEMDDDEIHDLITDRFETIYDYDHPNYNIALITDKKTGREYMFFGDANGGSICELEVGGNLETK